MKKVHFHKVNLNGGPCSRMAEHATSGSPSPDVSHAENATILACADTQSASLQLSTNSRPNISENDND